MTYDRKCKADRQSSLGARTTSNKGLAVARSFVAHRLTIHRLFCVHDGRCPSDTTRSSDHVCTHRFSLPRWQRHSARQHSVPSAFFAAQVFATKPFTSIESRLNVRLLHGLHHLALHLTVRVSHVCAVNPSYSRLVMNWFITLSIQSCFMEILQSQWTLSFKTRQLKGGRLTENKMSLDDVWK